MSFKVGETVVYPHHGAAYIEDISEKIMRGEKRLYLTLRIIQGDMVIQVPADSIEQVGLRDVSNDEQLEQVFAVLREENVEEPSNWSRRYKANGEKLTSGDVKKVAEVVRDLTRRNSDRGLSAGEKRMLAQAHAILGSEVALGRGISEDEATELLNEILGEFVLPLDSTDTVDTPLSAQSAE
ncbi:CarD family transcriptional regulator [Arcanobacterium pinnipediorum]|uniref:CarD family transcriptional regulator n=1 Tax=Arcanobacterium pinnipediorum TaxID=1503041 RepID=A0ABY5AJ74_9ACTO|nr:CarD family transcriptional regulator [Arcanobacterium pinnipediorum]USR79289.1 CarD family transcriptional regulator [Arcanobacterium pinnipediorum]